MNPTHPPLLASLRALPRPVWILFFGTFLNKFGSFVIPFLTIYMTRLGFSPAQAGLAIGAYGAGNFVACAVGGHLADTLGRRRTIMLSMISGALTMLLLSQARTLSGFLALSALAGLAGEFYRPASSALLADLVPPGQRVVAFSAFRMAFNAGWAFGPATAGFLAAHSYTWLFVGDALTSLLFAAVAWFALPRTVPAKSSANHWAEALKAIRHDRKFHQVICASLAIAFIFFQMISTLGLHITSLGFSAATYGAIISLNGVLVVFFELPLTTITRRFPARRVMAIGYALVGIGFGFLAFAHSVAEIAFAMMIFTLGEMIAIPVSSAYLADLTPPHLRGRYMGVSGLTWSFGLIFGSCLGMTLFSHSPMALWLSCGALGFVAAAIISRDIQPVGETNRCEFLDLSH